MAHLRIQHVVSGDYYVGQKTPIMLKAVLGTCVGVALYDLDAGVGGLIHLLLPEPVSPANSDESAKYASTGLPLLLNALYEAGASRERLKACVAGGALVCPTSECDLDLDIGGHTAELAVKILDDQGIPIERAETGGFSTYCLRLNLQNFEPSIELAGAEEVSEDAAIQIPSPQEINRAIDRLLPIPQVALKVLRLIDEDTHDKNEVAREIRKDQVISGRTLQLCNSVLFERRYKIDSVDDAVVMLGRDFLAKLVMSVAVKSFIDQCSKGYSFCKGGLFHHAVGTAVIAEQLARLTQKVKPFTAYTAGLLHDIGKVVLDQFVASAYPLFYRGVVEGGHNALDVENKIFGIDHAAVGSELATMWSFPENLLETIKYHANPESTTVNPELVHVVYLADLIMSKFHPGLEMERLDTANLTTKLQKIGLSMSEFPAIVDQIPHKVFDSVPELAIN